jgi:hypothetical protein
MNASVIPYTPLDAKRWRLATELRPLDPSRGLEVVARRDSQLVQ